MNDFWHAVAMLRLDRPLGLAELQGCFGAGKPAEGLVGFRRGRLIATTCGYGVDGPFEGLARLWMPWRGQHFSRQAAEGVNLFTVGGRRAIRTAFPRYRGFGDDEQGTSAFRFVTSVAPSVSHPDVTVLRLDYRSVRENPSFPIRKVLDELVQIDVGLYLGQELMTWGGRPHRVAWFSLEPGT
ncbi:MAG: hypothetical protein M3Q20_04105 [Actinomycetota bacterium]|nr:hypothetical protein [Actinomycetota bacterium]